jgi:hypothetical protein
MVALAWLIIMTLRLSAATPGRATIAGRVVSDEFSMRWCDVHFSVSLRTRVSDEWEKKWGRTKHWKKEKECYKCYKVFRQTKVHKFNHLINQHRSKDQETITRVVCVNDGARVRNSSNIRKYAKKKKGKEIQARAAAPSISLCLRRCDISATTVPE